MATEILNQVQENCPRDLKTIEDVLAKKTSDDTIKDMIVNKVSYSYYATPLQNDPLPRSDVIVGFIANTPNTFFTSSIGGSLTTTKLNMGELQFAFYDNVYPYVSTTFQVFSISNLNGSGYVIHANLDSEPRVAVSTTNFMWGDCYFAYGHVITKEQAQSSEGKNLIEEADFNSPTKTFDRLRETLSTHWAKYQ